MKDENTFDFENSPDDLWENILQNEVIFFVFGGSSWETNTPTDYSLQKTQIA